jgi:DNA-binding response OmpR family regulator
VKVLVVEDELLISMVVAMTLIDAGHEVVGPVATAAEGLALAHEHRPDFALLDIDLGVGGSGVTLARRLHEDLRIRSLFVSGSADKARAARVVAFGLLLKPFDARLLLDAISAFASVSAGRRLAPPPAGLELFGTHPA